MSSTESLVSFEDIEVEFLTEDGPVAAVNGLSFTVKPGEVLAIVGESGSGKSVTTRAALGLLPESAQVRGRITYKGVPGNVIEMTNRELRTIRGVRASMIFQEPAAALNPAHRVGMQIVEALRSQGNFSKKQAKARALDLLREVEMPEPERRYNSYPHELSGGQKQRVIIAIALAMEPDVIFADEPTTALDVTVQSAILGLLRKLRDDKGISIVLITHNLGVVADIADRVIVMRDGQVVESDDVFSLFRNPREGYTRMLLAAVPKMRSSFAMPIISAERHIIAEDVQLVYSNQFGRAPFIAVDSLSFELSEGEILGVVGESGSGKSTIAQAIAGNLRPHRGIFNVLGHDLRSAGRREVHKVRRDIGFVFQDPRSSLNPIMTIEESIAEPLRINGQYRKNVSRTRILELLDAVELPRTVAGRYPHELSGGQRQRIGLARALIMRPKILVADEPTSALDVSVQDSVLQLLIDIHRELQFSCVFITHDLAVVSQLADRVLVLEHGARRDYDSTEDVLTRPISEYTRTLLEAAPYPDPDIQRSRRSSVPPRRLSQNPT